MRNKQIRGVWGVCSGDNNSNRQPNAGAKNVEVETNQVQRQEVARVYFR